eukprot:3867246-Pyramimonas_sp.AAC.1
MLDKSRPSSLKQFQTLRSNVRGGTARTTLLKPPASIHDSVIRMYAALWRGPPLEDDPPSIREAVAQSYRVPSVRLLQIVVKRCQEKRSARPGRVICMEKEWRMELSKRRV